VFSETVPDEGMVLETDNAGIDAATGVSAAKSRSVEIP